jgi:hypothetical protein
MKTLMRTYYLFPTTLLFILGCASKQAQQQDAPIITKVATALPPDANLQFVNPNVEHKIIQLLPNPDVDSKVLRVETDPKVDYKIRVLSHGAQTQQGESLQNPNVQVTLPRQMHWIDLPVDELDAQNNGSEGTP